LVEARLEQTTPLKRLIIMSTKRQTNREKNDRNTNAVQKIIHYLYLFENQILSINKTHDF